jgi:hypothetical protein
VLYETFREIEREKRACRRVVVQMPVTINNTIGGQSLNLSADGILLTSQHPIAKGTDIKIQMLGKESQPIFTAAGTVIRSSSLDSMYHVAVYFMKNVGQELAHLFNERLLVPQAVI